MANTMLDGLKERIAKSAKMHQSVGVIVPVSNYADLHESLLSHMLTSKNDLFIYVSVTKTYDTITKIYPEIKDRGNIRFVDCISRAAGISKQAKNCAFVESPVMLEKILMELIHIYRTADHDGDTYVVLDSLSAFMIYNNAETVKEFFQHLVNKTRAENIHTITIVIEEEMDDSMNRIIFLNDKIIKVKESFI